jgi:mono/diheme cytochrome c family protein
MNYSMNTNLLRTLALAGLGALALAGLSACQDERTDEPPHQFLPDMDDSPKFKPQTETDFFPDGRAMRPHVAGTVAFGETSRTSWMDGAGNMRDRRADVDADLMKSAKSPSSAAFDSKEFRDTPGLWDGIDPTGTPFAKDEPAYVKTIPAAALQQFRAGRADRGEVYPDDDAAMKAMITRGQERFNIYCSVCHGFKGEGGDPAHLKGGVVGQRWRTPVPSYHDPKYSDKTVKTGMDGYIFNVIRNGVPDADATKPLKMPSYADKVSEIDAWAVVAYVRTLQAAWTETAPAGAAAPKPAAGAPATTNPSGAKPEGAK